MATLCDAVCNRSSLVALQDNNLRDVEKILSLTTPHIAIHLAAIRSATSPAALTESSYGASGEVAESGPEYKVQSVSLYASTESNTAISISRVLSRFIGH